MLPFSFCKFTNQMKRRTHQNSPVKRIYSKILIKKPGNGGGIDQKPLQNVLTEHIIVKKLKIWKSSKFIAQKVHPRGSKDETP